jgi:hypothetical protein
MLRLKTVDQHPGLSIIDATECGVPTTPVVVATKALNSGAGSYNFVSREYVSLKCIVNEQISGIGPLSMLVFIDSIVVSDTPLTNNGSNIVKQKRYSVPFIVADDTTIQYMLCYPDGGLLSPALLALFNGTFEVRTHNG